MCLCFQEAHWSQTEMQLQEKNHTCFLYVMWVGIAAAPTCLLEITAASPDKTALCTSPFRRHAGDKPGRAAAEKMVCLPALVVWGWGGGGRKIGWHLPHKQQWTTATDPALPPITAWQNYISQNVLHSHMLLLHHCWGYPAGAGLGKVRTEGERHTLLILLGPTLGNI